MWSEAPYAAIALGDVVVLSRSTDLYRAAGDRRTPVGPRFPDPVRRRRACGRRAVMVAASAWLDDQGARAVRRVAAFACGSGRHQLIVDHPQSRQDRPAARPTIRGRRDRATFAHGPPGFRSGPDTSYAGDGGQNPRRNGSASPSSSASPCSCCLLCRVARTSCSISGWSTFSTHVLRRADRRPPSHSQRHRTARDVADVDRHDLRGSRHVRPAVHPARRRAGRHGVLGMVDVPGGGVRRRASPTSRQAVPATSRNSHRSCMTRSMRCPRREDPDEQPSAGVVVHRIVNRP